ncbi:MAG: nitronate monooxygenase [Ruminococcaceae bacterium]|nr:nitronate monooxygenase [Oscillospiraceae bacterium]
MLKSKFCERVGTKYPIIQAGMGPFPTTELAIASANAGVLGIMSSSAIASQDTMPHIYDVFCKAAGAKREEGPAAVIEKMFIKAFEQTKDAQGIFGVNVMVSAEMLPWAKIVIETLIRLRNANPEMKKRFKVLYTSAGDPLPWGETVKANDLTWAHIVPSVKGALRCKKAGVDIIVASGHESGFHTSWEPVHSMILLPAVVEAINDDKTVVCGAGGFCDGKTLAAALLMGADGVQMGTRFLATQESDFAPLWKQSVVDAGDRATIVARGFVGPARWLKSARSDLHAQNTLKYSPGLYIGVPDDDTPQETIDKLTDYENDSINAAMAGDKENAMMAAGECAQRINDMPMVNDVVQQMVGDAEKILKGASALVG